MTPGPMPLAPTGYDRTGSRMLDQDAAREFERLRAHLGFASEPERLRIDGRYRIERALGRGAMGVVYLAVQPSIGTSDFAVAGSRPLD